MLQYQFDVFILFYTVFHKLIKSQRQTGTGTGSVPRGGGNLSWPLQVIMMIIMMSMVMIINIMMIMMMIILTTPGDYDDYDSGNDYYFYDDGYRFVQLSIQNWTNSILTTPGPPSLKMTKRGPPRFELILDKALCQVPRQQIIPGLGCQVTGVGAKEDLDLPVWGASSTRWAWASHESENKQK